MIRRRAARSWPLLAGPAVLLTAAPALAAGGDEINVWWEAFNIILLVSVLVFVSRKPVMAFLATRRTRIQDEIEASQRMLAEAEAKLDEWSGKAARLESDIAEIRQLTHERAARERTRILEEADRAAERVRHDAESAVERELGRARQTLREEASDLAVELAGKLLSGQVTDADRERLVDEFVTKLENGASDSRPGNA